MKQSSKNAESKFRTFDVVCYDNPKDLLPHFSQLVHFAYICHDHDIKEDTGELKETHYHIVMCFNNPRSSTGLLKEFLRYAKQNVFLEPCNNGIGCSYLYLMHKSKKAIAEGKIPYDERDIVSDDIGFWSKKATEACEQTENGFSNEKFLLDLVRYNEIQMVLVYGRDYIKNYDKYSKFKTDISDSFGIRNKDDIVTHIAIALENLM